MAKDQKLKDYIESVFKDSSSSDELFDTLRLAIKNKLNDPDLYKLLLSNPHLSNDELVLYTEQLSKEFRSLSFDLYNWTGYVFQTRDTDFSLLDTSFYYYQKAFFNNPEEHLPLVSVLQLYNYEFDYPTNQHIMQLVNTGVELVKKKSFVYREMSKHYKKMGNEYLSQRYEKMAEQEARKENQ